MEDGGGNERVERLQRIEVRRYRGKDRIVQRTIMIRGRGERGRDGAKIMGRRGCRG